MHLVQITLLTFLSFYTVDGLTCLQCDGVPQPRLCSRVVDCYEGEYCSTTKVLNEFGEHVYNLGCHTKKVCDNFTSTAKVCSECCGTSLCNAEACRQPGYPANRGPVCYNCAVHTDSSPCHDIDFCLEDEACSIVGRQLFSSEVLTSKCISKHACKEQHGGHVAIIGKRDTYMMKRTQQHTCDLCCNHDLCNRNCSTATAVVGPNVANNCNTNPCDSHGTCVRIDNGYTCLCDIGYEGSRCEKNIDDCIPGLCGSHGRCIDGVNKYTCSCDVGFTGTNCLTGIDDCISQPCASGGTCYDGVNSYTCICAPGFSGINCETNIDDCLPGLCGMGTCNDEVDNYTCACQSGFSGIHCETNIDDCLPGLCGMGTCIDEVDNYTCACQFGFSGSHCETNIDDCAPGVCGSNGTCIDEVNNYTCSCDSEFSGTNCEKGNFQCSNGSNATQCNCIAECTDNMDEALCACTQYGNDFVIVKNHVLNQYNILSLKAGYTDCKENCTRVSDCVSFEIRTTGECYLNSETPLTKPAAFAESGYYNLFVRKCQQCEQT